jgi:hypothetical protein
LAAVARLVERDRLDPIRHVFAAAEFYKIAYTGQFQPDRFGETEKQTKPRLPSS